MGRGPKDIRAHMIETARPMMKVMIEQVTGGEGHEPAPRHQHRDGRSGHPVHLGQVAPFRDAKS